MRKNRIISFYADLDATTSDYLDAIPIGKRSMVISAALRAFFLEDDGRLQEAQSTENTEVPSIVTYSRDQYIEKVKQTLNLVKTNNDADRRPHLE